MARALHDTLAEGRAGAAARTNVRTTALTEMEDAMKPTTLVIAAGVVVAGLALGAPVHAQSARITVGAVFSTGPQYWPQSPYPGRPGPGAYGAYRGFGAREFAQNRGFADGYEQGFDAAADRNRFDPWRERWYRGGTRGYDRSLRMTRDEYRSFYRRGFLQGYEAGYRDGQRGWRGGYDRRWLDDWRRGWR